MLYALSPTSHTTSESHSENSTLFALYFNENVLKAYFLGFIIYREEQSNSSCFSQQIVTPNTPLPNRIKHFCWIAVCIITSTILSCHKKYQYSYKYCHCSYSAERRRVQIITYNKTKVL